MGGTIIWIWLIVGGGAFITLFSMIFEKIVFSTVFDDPVLGKGFSVVAGWLAVSAVFGFFTTGFTGFNPRVFLPFAIPAVLVAVWFIREGFKLRGMQAELEAGIGPYDAEAARPFE